MHKETIIAVVIGLLFGLLVTVGVYKLQSVNDSSVATIPLAEEASPSASPSPDDLARLSISYPTQGLISTDADITITGKSDPNALLVLFANDTQQISEADDKGAFSIALSLKEGPNFFTIVAANQDGVTFSADRVVVYEKEVPIEVSPEASQSAR